MRKIKGFIAILTLLIFSVSIAGCGKVSVNTEQKNYEGRAFYEIFVRSFNDSNGDGIGDLKGVTEKLDYIKDLGVKGIWLMPINKATSYHGYDVDDYYSIEDDYGTMDDLQELLDEAHKRDIKVIMDLVVNHTSVNNKWFLDASKGKDSEFRDYYVWSDDMAKKNSSSAMGTKPWSQNGTKNELYYSIFWSGMPDLNMDNPKVVQEIKNVAKFYLDKGMDGFRLDAAKWIFDEKSKNVAFWKDFNEYIKSVNKEAVTVGEVWDSAYNTVEYTDCLDSFFEFSMGEYVTSRLSDKSIGNFIDDYNGIASMFKDNNSNFVMATFLRNHDQVRIMDVLNDDFKMKVAATMNLTLPGTPFIYYGEELGMKGGKPDENIRQPFLWDSKDMSKNTSWQKITNDPSKLAVDVAENDKESILNFYKAILKVKNNYKSLRYGEAAAIKCDNPDVMTMVRTFEDETTYVIANESDKESQVTIPKGTYEVLYSNDNREAKIKSNDSITVKAKEIMIITKK